MPSEVSSGAGILGNTPGVGTFSTRPGDTLSFTIPDFMRIDTGPSPDTRLSPNFMVSHLTGGDSEGGVLRAQEGLSVVQIAQNMQLLSYTVLERIRSQFQDRWTISEGLYNPYENETVADGSLNHFFSRGLAVGIQFPEQPDSVYFDVAQWCVNNLVFESIVLSYIDYDPTGVNEPTLIVAVRPGSNSKSVSTEMNHRSVGSELMDLSDD